MHIEMSLRLMYYKSEIHVIDLVSVHHNITAVQEIYNTERERDRPAQFKWRDCLAHEMN